MVCKIHAIFSTLADYGEITGTHCVSVCGLVGKVNGSRMHNGIHRELYRNETHSVSPSHSLPFTNQVEFIVKFAHVLP